MTESSDKDWGKLRAINIVVRIAVVLAALVTAIWMRLSR